MNNGISIYFGLDNSLEENIELVQAAKEAGLKRIFTSLQIPETDLLRMRMEMDVLLDLTNKLKMEVIADVNAGLLRDSRDFATAGIQRMRLDDGYSFSEIASFSRRFPVSLNASTLDGLALGKLAKYGMNFENAEAIFNFYPHPFTGQSGELIYERTQLLKASGLRVSAFVPSQNRKRGPLHLGLPTIEQARKLSVSQAALQLASLGVDGVFIGDSLPSKEELEALAKVEKPEVIEIPCEFFTSSLDVRGQIFTVRPDISPYVVRSIEARKIFAENNLPKSLPSSIKRGSILMDNELYGRYKGELSLAKLDLPEDEKVNVIGKIREDSLYLLDCLWPGMKFKLV